jgi:hypothetical protein
MISWKKAGWMAAHPVLARRELKAARDLAQGIPNFSDRPWLEESDIQFITGFVDQNHAVIEYGAGSSTLYFARHALEVHSVDSSRSYVTAVAAEAARRSLSNVHLSRANIGPVGEWGWPIDTYPTKKNRERWIAYLDAPWSSIGDAPVGLVMVDGRFRVACAAYSIAKLIDRGQRNVAIFLDDFIGREDLYGQLSEIATLERTQGRGVIVIPRNIDSAMARSFAERWVTDLC